MFPEREALAWFEWQVTLGAIAGDRAPAWREWFATELAAWRRSSAATHAEGEYDWNRPGEVERAVARVRELVNKDLDVASSLLRDADGTGHPVAGRAVLELADDPSIDWEEFDRRWFVIAWRDAILTRTFGCADPEDPSTW